MPGQLLSSRRGEDQAIAARLVAARRRPSRPSRGRCTAPLEDAHQNVEECRQHLHLRLAVPVLLPLRVNVGCWWTSRVGKEVKGSMAQDSHIIHGIPWTAARHVVTHASALWRPNHARRSSGVPPPPAAAASTASAHVSDLPPAPREPRSPTFALASAERRLSL